MKTLILTIAFAAFNASAAEFPSKEVDRAGVPGNLKETGATAAECVKKVSEAALHQMQIKNLHAHKVKDLDSFTDKFMKSANDRKWSVTYKDEAGKEYNGAMRIMFFHSHAGISCRPWEVDITEGSFGKFYRWKVDKNHENGSVSYVDILKQFESSEAPESCVKNPACRAQMEALTMVPATGTVPPSAAPTVLDPAAAGR